MRKLISAAIAGLTLTLALGSCNEETGTHLSQFIYPNSNSHPYYLGYQPVYADQPSDSVIFATTEDWRLRLEYSDNTGGWCTLPPELMANDFKIQENAIYSMGGTARFAPNTTGHKRRVLITLDAGEYDCSAGFVQLPYLCVSRPMRFVITNATETSLTSRDSIATLIAEASTLSDSIRFRVYDGWRLSVKPTSWISLRQNVGQPGQHTVIIDYQPNLTNQARLDTIFLTSGAVADTIPVLQRGQPLAGN